MSNRSFYLPAEAVEDYRSLLQILRHAAKTYPGDVAYAQFEGRNDLSEITFSQVERDVDRLRAALIARGAKGRHVAIMGETSAQWIEVYLALTAGVGVAVPIDRELPPETIATQLDFADADIIFCSEKCLRKLAKVFELGCGVKTVVVMRSGDASKAAFCENAVTMDALLEEGGKLLDEKGADALPEKVDPDETAVIIYTSGTTGANKGVMLSNRNIMGTLRGCARLLHFPKTSFSVLPVNHSYELHAHLMSCLYCGTKVYINDDLKHLVKNIERFRPEMSCMVPVMLELIVKKIKKGIDEANGRKRFRLAGLASNAARHVGIDLRGKLFGKILEPFGGNLKMIICGGAALSQETIDFMDTIGVRVFNGYGITECSPVAAVNGFEGSRKFSVGHLLPTMEVRIADPDADGIGEIQLRGDNVMQGYYKAPEDNEKVFTEDGWFRTGDLGYADKNNFLFLRGRLKNLIILPNGKNVSPEELETALREQIPYIKECVVYADSMNTGIYALIYIDPEFCREHLLIDPVEMKAFMEKDIDAFNSKMPGFKRLTAYDVTVQEFAKNTTHKIQRFKIDALRK